MHEHEKEVINIKIVCIGNLKCSNRVFLFKYSFFSDKAWVIGIAGARKIPPNRYYDSYCASFDQSLLAFTSRINQVSQRSAAGLRGMQRGRVLVVDLNA